uniref:Transposable element Mu1 sequence n=1 Tax=Zea mays TaxID=4577 RepID=Q41861_MAIZE|nr:unnamed protein product [Zea mays]
MMNLGVISARTGGRCVRCSSVLNSPLLRSGSVRSGGYSFLASGAGGGEADFLGEDDSDTAGNLRSTRSPVRGGGGLVGAREEEVPGVEAREGARVRGRARGEEDVRGRGEVERRGVVRGRRARGLCRRGVQHVRQHRRAAVERGDGDKKSTRDGVCARER